MKRCGRKRCDEESLLVSTGLRTLRSCAATWTALSCSSAARAASLSRRSCSSGSISCSKRLLVTGLFRKTGHLCLLAEEHLRVFSKSLLHGKKPVLKLGVFSSELRVFGFQHRHSFLLFCSHFSRSFQV